MNEKIDLTKILSNCPRGFKLYSIVHGEVTFFAIEDGSYPICVLTQNGVKAYYSSDGRLYISYGKCVLFPSEEQEDWSKFTAPWLKKEKFDPKTLKLHDKVLVRDEFTYSWASAYFYHIKEDSDYQVSEIRSMIAMLGLEQNVITRKMKTLSGGEIVKILLCKIFQ